MGCHWRHQANSTVATPTAQTANRSDGTEMTDGDGATGTGAMAANARGTMTCSIATEKLVAAIAGAERHSNRLPMAMSHDNGIRNFTDAASHSQYRTAARFFLSASVISAATAANSVDCQR